MYLELRESDPAQQSLQKKIFLNSPHLFSVAFVFKVQDVAEVQGITSKFQAAKWKKEQNVGKGTYASCHLKKVPQELSNQTST